MTFLHQ
jgi:hypothetical protein